MPVPYSLLASESPLYTIDRGEVAATLTTANLMIGLLCVTSLGALAVVYLRARFCYSCWVARKLQRMVDARIAKVDSVQNGWPVILEVSDNAGMMRLTSKVHDVQRRWIIVTQPSAYRDTRPIIGSPLVVTASGPSAAFRFYATLFDCKTENGKDLWYLKRPSWVERVQRREFYRINVNLPTVISPIVPSNVSSATYAGMMIDISAGGFRAQLAHNLEIGAQIRVRLPEQALRGTSFEARVLECNSVNDEDEHAYEAHCEFLYVDEELRNRLVGFCFDLERERMRARLC